MAIPKKPRARPTKPGKAHRVPADTSDIWTNAVVATSTPVFKAKNGHAQGMGAGRAASPVVLDLHAQLGSGVIKSDSDGVKSAIPKVSGSSSIPTVPLRNHKTAPNRATGRVKVPTRNPIILEHIQGNGTTVPHSPTTPIPTANTADLLATLPSLELENSQLRSHTTDGVKTVEGWKAHVHDLSELINDRNFEIADKNSAELIRLRNLYNESVGVYQNKLSPLQVERDELQLLVGTGRDILQYTGREHVWEAGVQGFLREVRQGKRELMEVEKSCDLVVELVMMRQELVGLRKMIEGLKEEGWSLTVKLAGLHNVAE